MARDGQGYPRRRRDMMMMMSIGQIWREIRVSLVKCKSWTRMSIKITSYLGTDSGSSWAKLDEVKMVLYSRGVWNAQFSLAVY